MSVPVRAPGGACSASWKASTSRSSPPGRTSREPERSIGSRSCSASGRARCDWNACTTTSRSCASSAAQPGTVRPSRSGRSVSRSAPSTRLSRCVRPSAVSSSTASSGAGSATVRSSIPDRTRSIGTGKASSPSGRRTITRSTGGSGIAWLIHRGSSPSRATSRNPSPSGASIGSSEVLSPVSSATRSLVRALSCSPPRSVILVREQLRPRGSSGVSEANASGSMRVGRTPRSSRLRTAGPFSSSQAVRAPSRARTVPPASRARRPVAGARRGSRRAARGAGATVGPLSPLGALAPLMSVGALARSTVAVSGIGHPLPRRCAARRSRRERVVGRAQGAPHGGGEGENSPFRSPPLPPTEG